MLICLFSVTLRLCGRFRLFHQLFRRLKSRLKAVLYTLLAIVADSFYRATGHCLFAGEAFGFVFRLLADIGVRLLERPSKVCGSSLSADVAIYAGRIDVESAVNIVLNFVIGIGHGSADYED